MRCAVRGSPDPALRYARVSRPRIPFGAGLMTSLFWPCHQSNGHQLVLVLSAAVLVIEMSGSTGFAFVGR